MTPLWRMARNEVLAIGPIWLACCVGVAAAPLWHAVVLAPIAILAYVFGSVAIGAHVMGHEHAHRTLGLLLAQPIRRATTLAVKLGVLAIALVTLTAIASVGPYAPILRFPGHASLDSRVVYLPTVIGLTLAPYLALVARGTLGGAVFSIAVPGVVLVLGDLLGLALYGVARPGENDRLKYTLFPAVTLTLCALAAAGTWRRFARLEILDDSRGHLALPSAAAAGGAEAVRSRRHPLWLLVTKELRLQQMAFIVAALHVLFALGLGWFEPLREIAPPIPWLQLIALYGCLVSMLIGSLASAEERQLGTLEWQSLLPTPRRTQFAVKVAVVFGLAIACAVVLPLALASVAAGSYRGAIPAGFLPWLCLGSLACAVAGLYVSTVTASGVKAVAVALPFVAGSFLLLRTAGAAFWWGLVRLGVFDPRLQPVRRVADAQAMSIAAAALAAIGAVVLFLAQHNHWSPGRTAGQVARQLTAIAAVVAAASAGMFLLGLK